MQIHQLKPVHKPKKPQKIGRGGKRGTYSGRGGKGQTARSGHRLKPIIRELLKRYPKLRGYRFKSKARNLKSETAILNLDILDKKFDEGEKVNPETLLKKKLIRKIGRRMPKVKILGKGKLTKKLIIEGCQFSKNVRKILSNF